MLIIYIKKMKIKNKLELKKILETNLIFIIIENSYLSLIS